MREAGNDRPVQASMPPASSNFGVKRPRSTAQRQSRTSFETLIQQFKSLESPSQGPADAVAAETHMQRKRKPRPEREGNYAPSPEMPPPGASVASHSPASTSTSTMQLPMGGLERKTFKQRLRRQELRDAAASGIKPALEKIESERTKKAAVWKHRTQTRIEGTRAGA